MNDNNDNRTDSLMHYQLLRHAGHGVTELRIIAPMPRVAYVDNENDFVRLCMEMDGKVPGIYVGVQPRPPQFYDMAPGVWTPAVSTPAKNCATDQDIEFITGIFFDCDVNTPMKKSGHPASQAELRNSLQTARLIASQPELENSGVIACSGNGHYVFVSLVPIVVYGRENARQYKWFCQELINRISGQLPDGVRVDPVYNLSRIMRIMGTLNKKGIPVNEREHRRSCFVTTSPENRSNRVHHRILNTDVEPCHEVSGIEYQTLRCNLKNIEQCQFIQWCRKCPQQVSEPHLFGLITNLIRLDGGKQLIHDISNLDKQRYDYQDTEYIINRVLQKKYLAVNCRNLVSIQTSDHNCFTCTQIENCSARAPMYMAVNRII